MPRKRQESFWALAGRYSSLAFLLPAATLAGYVVGRLLDRWLGTSFLTIVCLVLGMAGGFVEFFRQALKNDGQNHR
jgi:F0F1-type ATP synthase assembly protein I